MHGGQILTLCSPQIGIDPESNLGGAVYDREMLRALAELGVRVTIPLPKGEPHDEVENWKIVRTSRHRWKYYEYNLIFRRAVARLISDGRQFDVLRAHTAHSVGAGLLGLARRHRIPAHLHYHHWERHRIRNFIERLTMHRYDLITTDSEFSRRELVERYSLRNRVEVIFPGVSRTCTPRPADPDLRERYAGRRLLLSVGVLVERKNHSFLLRVLERLKREGRDELLLVVVGSGPLGERLQSEARELGLASAVEFAGRVSEEIKRAYYDLCEIFVFPSLLEGFGMAAAEAMAHGKPVVASNRSSIAEVLEEGRTGFLADPTDERDFVVKIGRLLDSPELRAEMGREGMKRVAEEFDFKRSAERLLWMYREITGKVI